MPPINYKGTIFTSYRQAAKYVGISNPAFFKRFKKYQADPNFTLDNLFDKKNAVFNAPVSYKGKTFINHSEAARFIGVTSVTFYRRYKKYREGQISLDKLFTPGNYACYNLPAYHGHTFSSKREAANFLGISQTAFTGRLRRYYDGKYTLDDLFSDNPKALMERQRVHSAFHYQDKTFHSVKEAANYLGIAASSFRARLQNYQLGDITLDELFRSSDHPQGKMLKYNQHTFYSYHEAADFVGISYTSFHERFKKYQAGKITIDELYLKPDSYRLCSAKNSRRS